MTTLTVNVPSLVHAGDAEVVTIVDRTLRPFARVAAGASITMRPGLYLVSAVLADGRLAEQPVDVLEDADNEVTLVLPPPEDRAPLHQEEMDRPLTYFHPQRRPSTRAKWSLRLRFARTGAIVPMTAWQASISESSDERRSGDSRRHFEVAITTHLDLEPLLAQVATVGSPVWNLALPIRRSRTLDSVGARLRVVVGPDSIRPSAWLDGGSRVDLIAACLSTGRIREAAELAAAYDLLEAKYDDPVGAALGAYALLRVDRLHGGGRWVENLARDFSRLPDAHILAGELARRQEDERLTALHYDEALRRGLPLFADGLSLLASHLRGRAERGPDGRPGDLRIRDQAGHHTEAGPKPAQPGDPLIKPRRPRRARSEQVLAVTALTAYGQIMLTYPGKHPFRPDRSSELRQRVTSRGWMVVEP